MIRFRNTQLTSRLLSLCVATTCVGFAGAQSAQPDHTLDDMDIGNAVQREMMEARGVSSNNIDITVTNGVVELTGEVDNMLARDRAARIAQMIKGVESVSNQITVRWSGLSDADVATFASQALRADPATDSWEIDVACNDGEVTLNGTVESFAERELAAKVVKGVQGVRNLVNNIVINAETDRPDYEVQRDIAQRLRWNLHLDDALIETTVNDGKVTLTGTVGSAYERRLAIADAWVSGVTSVDADGLNVEWWARDDMQRESEWSSLTDPEIRDAVKRAYRLDPRVASFRPTIFVQNGEVTLTGKVTDLKAKRAAAQIASDTLGVHSVNNFLKVRPDRDRDDTEIAEDVRSALNRDPYVERSDIRVVVTDDAVNLYGRADSYFERAQAEDAATRTIGAREVHNYIDVGYDITTYTPIYDWDPVMRDFAFDNSTLTSVYTKLDSTIESDIHQEMFWSPFVDSDDINVRVEDGVATLTGVVDGPDERDAAIENAIEGGAVRVRSQLRFDDF